MILIQASHISKSFQGESILEDVSIQVQKGERVGLVGVNGAGKSTLLKILTGELSHDAGEIMKAKGVTLGYLAQNTGLESEATIWQEMMEVFAPLREMEQKMRQLEQQMGDPSVIENDEEYGQLMEEYSLLSESFQEQGGYRYEADTRNVLHGLRFYENDYDTLIKTLSGGQKTRLALAKLLLQHPDVLVLDEPTNHLDMDTLSWLEQYLQSYDGGILLVSHDRYLLDDLVNVVYEIERTRATRYPGNYTRFLQLKAERIEQQQKRFDRQQTEIKRMEDFIQRNIARASTTKRAQSRRKTLDKLERIDRPNSHIKKASFSFEIERESGHDVLKAENLSMKFDREKPLFEQLSFEITRGERVALIGANGTGKSTLLKILMGDLNPSSGSIRWGSNVSLGYYDQEHQHLHMQKTVLQELWDDYPQMLERDVRTVLGRFLFSGDDVKKQVSVLSGGEKARLALAKLMLKKANVLILDEPTNHLDIYSREVLEDALYDYEGTIIFVSHDRYFLNKMATQIWELSDRRITSYLGNYDDFRAKKQELAELKQLAEQRRQSSFAAPDRENGKPNDREAEKLERKRKRRLEELENTISELEQKISDLEQQLYEPEVYNDHERVREIQNELERYKEQWEHCFAEWEELQNS